MDTRPCGGGKRRCYALAGGQHLQHDRSSRRLRSCLAAERGRSCCAFSTRPASRFVAAFADAAIPAFGRDGRVNPLLGAGHFLSHFYQLCLPPLFIAWQQALTCRSPSWGWPWRSMSAAAAVMQTPMGFLVDRYGARPFLVGGTLPMTLSIATMGLATAYWQVVGLALLSGIGNSVIHPADYAILSGSVDRAETGPLLRLSHLCRACRVCRRTAGDGGIGAV